MSSKTQTHTFTHPELGAITGLAGSPSTPNVVHFRSIPFASFPARFRQSVLLDHIPSSRTFTEYGTYCPSPVQDQQSANLGGWLLGEEEKAMDEMTCLNLTISAPKDALGEKGKALPVMVYVHGGGFTEGSGHISALHSKLSSS
jgi:carboxylesterase type B